MALRQTRLYYNTGFNVGNTPGNTSILNNANYLDLEAHWDYQDFFLENLKLKCTYDNVKNADYLKYGDAYYWITGIRMINTNTAELMLSLDALASMGGAKSLSYTSGMLKRAHPLNDNDFDNTLTEPVSTQRSLQIAGTVVEAGPSAPDHQEVYLSTLSLDQEIKVDDNGNIAPLHGSATTYTTLAGMGEEVGSVIVPNSPKACSGSQVNGHFITSCGYYADQTGHTGINTIRNNIAYLRSLGLEQAVIACYDLPKYYGTLNHDTGKNHLASITQKPNTNIPAQAWNAGTSSASKQWKKSKYMINKYVVVSRLTGEVKTYNAKDVCRYNNDYISAPLFMLGCDANLNGKPYLWSRYFDGQDNGNRFNANGICGMEWLNLPITVYGASGSLWVNNDYIRNTAQVATDTERLGYNSIKSIVGNVGNLIGANKGKQLGDTNYPLFTASQGQGLINFTGGVIDTSVNTYLNGKALQIKAEKLDTDFTKETEFALPSVSGSPAKGLQLVIPNGFYIYHYVADNKDITKFDEFFTKYGYAQDCVFDKAYLTDHWNLGYVYIQTSDIHIGRTGKANDAGIAVKNLAESQLDGGIRIWDRLPG